MEHFNMGLELQAQGLLGELDLQLAILLRRLHPQLNRPAALAAACTSHALSEGHTCLPLTQVVATLQSQSSAQGQKSSVQELRHALLASGAAVEAGQERDNPRPLVLDQDNRLALLRWYMAESRIAQDLGRRAALLGEVDTARAQQILQQLFPAAPTEQQGSGPNLQQCAAALALSKRLLILCGGPGTGKTYTLARILALSTSLAPTPPRIALAAPTGRAAMRLGESIRAAAADIPALFRDLSLPEPQTLHRLLGFQPQNGTFLRKATNPLLVDLLVVDEASMVDALLLEALLAALPAQSRLILCGDPGQLPPVEPGSLLHALQNVPEPCYSTALKKRLQLICADSLPTSHPDTDCKGGADMLAECRITLRQAHRFGRESGILALARALEDAEAETFIQLLSRPWPDIHLHAPADATTLLPGLLREWLSALHKAQGLREAADIFARFRVLCALREGPWGVSGINGRCKQLVQRQGLTPARQEIYRGLPILILKNDYGQHLYNGDTGIIWPDADGTLKAWFEGEEDSRALSPETLPSWQPAYAMTVHKAQGAEFARVLLLLPPEDNPLLSRELLYTAITRAKQELILFAGTELLHTIAARRLIRHSNLDRLLKAKTPPV